MSVTTRTNKTKQFAVYVGDWVIGLKQLGGEGGLNMAFDLKCYEIAKEWLVAYNLPNEAQREEWIYRLAQRIQEAIEEFIEDECLRYRK